MAGRVLFACGTDNDGYPTCMGDTSTCAPDGQCVGWPEQSKDADERVEQA